MSFSLSGYLARIHFSGDYAPDLSTLQRLHQCHTCAIPFENIDVLLGRSIQLDDDAVFNKLVRGGRGGYCYEHNALLRRALVEIGFQVDDLAARVLLARPVDVPPRTHRLLLVTIGEQRWLADVGFGGKTLTSAIGLELDCEQGTPHDIYRITQLGEDYLLSVREDDGWLPLYRFDLQPQYLSDYEVANHYVATWPESHFRHNLMLCLKLANAKTNTLNNRQLTLAGETRQLADAAEVYQALQTHFGLRVDDPQHGFDFTGFAQAFGLLEDKYRKR